METNLGDSIELNSCNRIGAVTIFDYGYVDGNWHLRGTIQPSDSHLRLPDQLPRGGTFRLIYARNAPWAVDIWKASLPSDAIELEIYAEWSDTFAQWVQSPMLAATPREGICQYTFNSSNCGVLLGFDYFRLYDKRADKMRQCSCEAHLGDLRLNRDEDKDPGTFDICLHKLGIVGTNDTILIFEKLPSCLANVAPPFDIKVHPNSDIDAPMFSTAQKLFEAIEQNWSVTIEISHTAFSDLEKHVYNDPDNVKWGDELWRYLKCWHKFDRLLSIHTQLTESSMELVRGTPNFGKNKLFWEYLGHALYTKMLGILDKNKTQITQDLTNPTANMLDMVYKRVAIKDARQSLMLNESLWRLSWITFIFLPLTFITGVFGMNVDLFADNPSIKWWFITAIPLMMLVFIGLLIFRRFYSVARRKEKQERDMV